MNKIGLKLTKISAGVQELLTVNGDDWTRKVVDIRADLKLLSGKALEDGVPVLMVSFTSKGSLITLCHTIPGRSGDLVSAWIFIPAEISISAAEEYSIIEMMQTELAKPQVENWNYLEQYFAKEYPLKQLYFPFKESSATNLAAVRYYGVGTDFGLRELLGDRLYQSVYTEHRYVFLIDRNSGIIADDKLVNYTNEPIRETIILTPPQVPADVTVKLNGEIFSSPRLGTRGERLKLSFERAGFTPLISEITAGTPFSIPQNLPWQRCIKPSDFYITDNDNSDINSSCSILINGQRLGTTGFIIPEAECKALHVRVENPFCEPYSSTFNLMLGSPVYIVLKRKKTSIVYVINGQECPNLTECPKGYTYSEARKGHTIYRYCSFSNQKKGDKWKLFTFIGSAVALLLGIAIGFLLCMLIFKNTPNIFGKKTGKDAKIENPKPDQDQNKPESNVIKIYDCLSQDTWIKDELEAEPDLKGFYQDLVLFKTDKLLGEWKSKIDPLANPKWGEFLHAIEQVDNPALLNDFRWGDKSSVTISSYITMMKSHVNKKKNTNHSTNTSAPRTERPANQPANKPAGNNSLE